MVRRQNRYQEQAQPLPSKGPGKVSVYVSLQYSVAFACICIEHMLLSKHMVIL